MFPLKAGKTTDFVSLQNPEVQDQLVNSSFFPIISSAHLTELVYCLKSHSSHL